MRAKIDVVLTGIVIGSIAIAACSEDSEPPPAEVSDLTEEAVEVPRVGILDRQGRPEISNFLIISDRTAYNAEDTFELTPEGRSFFTAKLHSGLEMWDAMDGFDDWTPEGGEHPLVRILIDDMLIVDMSKPCAYDTPTFLDIEISAVRGVEHQTCGGRFPNEDAVDVLQTWYVNDFLAGTVADGVDEPTKWATAKFPYLATKNSLLKFWGGFF
jgi:hypothetical protein